MNLTAVVHAYAALEKRGMLPYRGLHNVIPMRDGPGATIPRHRHARDEQIFVREGSVVDERGTSAAGRYARRPPGCVHAVASPTGALVLAITPRPTEPV